MDRPENKTKLDVKLIPVITEKPIVKDVDFIPGRTVAEYLADVDLKDQRIILNGKIITDLSYVPAQRDEIIVTPDVEAPVIAAIIGLASAAWAFAVAHPFLAAAFLLVAAYSIYSFLTMPRVPTFNFSESFDKSSPTYTWEGGRTIQEVGTPVPIIYGVHKCWGNIINQYQTTDGDKNYLHVLLLLCEGPIGGVADIKINDNPIENYEGVTTELRLGTNDQSVIPGFDDLHELNDLNIKLEQNAQFLYQTIRDDVEAAEFYFAFPQGLFKVANNGSQQSWTVSYRVDYRIDGDPNWTLGAVQNITHNNRSNFRRIHRIDNLTAGRYHFRPVKVSDNSTLSLIGDFHLVTIDEIRTEAIAYVNSALLAVHALATNQLSGALPNISCIVNGTYLARGASLDNVVLLLEFEGTDGSHTIIDDSLLNHVCTPILNDFAVSEIDTSVAARGTGSFLVRRSVGSYAGGVEITRQSDEFMCTRAMTFEGFFHFTERDQAGTTDVSNYMILYGRNHVSNGPGYTIVLREYYVSGVRTGFKIHISFCTLFTISQLETDLITTMVPDVFYHIAITFDPTVPTAGDVEIFLDKVLIASGSVNNVPGATVETNPVVCTGPTTTFLSNNYNNWDRFKITQRLLTPDEFQSPEVDVSANPIRCLEDLMTNPRYGLGNYMSASDFDMDRLTEMAAYCDELVPCGEIDDTITENADEDVVLDLEFEGEDGATEFIDSSQYGHIVTPSGGTQIDTAQKKFDAASGLFENNGGLTVPYHAGFQINANDELTIVTHFKLVSHPTAGQFFVIYSRSSGAIINRGIYVNNTTNKYFLFSFANAGNNVDIQSQDLDLDLDRWYELAFRKKADRTLDILLDREVICTPTLVASNVFGTFSNDFKVGSDGSAHFDGWMDRFIFTRRYLEPIDFSRDFREEFGERFRLDVVIDAQSRALDLITTLATSFRGMPFYSAGKVHLTIDKPQTTRRQLFTMGNIIKNSFSQKWKSPKEIFNVVEVQFLNKDKDYAQDSILVIDQASLAAGNPLRIHRIRHFITRTCQAVREAWYALFVSKLIDKGMGWKTQINALVSQPGDRVDFSHDLPQVGYSGRVKTGSSTSVVQLDREVTLVTGKTYELMIHFSDDTVEIKTVIDAPGTYTAITVGSVFSQQPMFFDNYVFGEQTILAEPTRIIGIERDNVDNITLHTVEYNENVYQEVNVVQPETRFSELTVSFPLIQGLTLTEKVIKLEGSVIANHIEVWFTKPNTTNNPVYVYEKARIYISDDGGANYRLVGEATGESFVITEGIEVGQTYRVKVTSVMKNGQEGSLSAAMSSDITITSDTSFLFPVDAWSQNKEFKLTNLDRIRENFFNAGYVRDVLVLTTADTWQDVSGVEDWDGFDMDAIAVEASGMLEQVKPINLGQVLNFKVTPDFNYKNVSGGTITMEISISDDDITYTAFDEVDPVEIYSAQYIKTRYILETSDTAKQVWWYGGTFLVFL